MWIELVEDCGYALMADFYGVVCAFFDLAAHRFLGSVQPTPPMPSMRVSARCSRKRQRVDER